MRERREIGEEEEILPVFVWESGGSLRQFFFFFFS